ncbi:uncharacterized protein F5147DRAFT_791050 [Suillus discolor]|uniref:Uncharacterized protein n=1 Tax=Suillus discolor TaxID=1912936 RepID=A0A9P7JWH3_9AGAM|nr:uncharacterized protein F5147DRAFT_791050 [Suillus discolor]KAG2112531.1 hypothetical protein F5147DRAFT_791050 [Suillus discolor]
MSASPQNPAPQWSVHPQHAACTNRPPTLSSLPTTALYNARPSTQVVCAPPSTLPAPTGLPPYHPCPPLPSTMPTPALKWSVHPRHAICTNWPPTLSSLPTTALYNAHPSTQVVCAPPARYLHQPASQFIILAISNHIPQCPTLPGLSYLPTHTHHLGIALFIFWTSQVLAYAHRVIAWESHHSDVKFHGHVNTASAILSICCFLERAERQEVAAVSLDARRQRMQTVRLKSKVCLLILVACF